MVMFVWKGCGDWVKTSQDAGATEMEETTERREILTWDMTSDVVTFSWRRVLQSELTFLIS